jgi:hypothetical protein
MTKRELLERIGTGGVKAALASQRIAAKNQFQHLGDEDQVTVETLTAWAEEGSRDPLSEADVRLIAKVLEKEACRGK